MKETTQNTIELEKDLVDQGFTPHQYLPSKKPEIRVVCKKGFETFVVKAIAKTDYFGSNHYKQLYNMEAKVGARVKNNFIHLVSQHGFFYT